MATTFPCCIIEPGTFPLIILTGLDPNREGWTCGGQDDGEKDLYLTAPASMLKLDTINGVLDTNGFLLQW